MANMVPSSEVATLTSRASATMASGHKALAPKGPGLAKVITFIQKDCGVWMWMNGVRDGEKAMKLKGLRERECGWHRGSGVMA